MFSKTIIFVSVVSLRSQNCRNFKGFAPCIRIDISQLCFATKRGAVVCFEDGPELVHNNNIAPFAKVLSSASGYRSNSSAIEGWWICSKNCIPSAPPSPPRSRLLEMPQNAQLGMECFALKTDKYKILTIYPS